jgi:hypothetical protein
MRKLCVFRPDQGVRCGLAFPEAINQRGGVNTVSPVSYAIVLGLFPTHLVPRVALTSKPVFWDLFLIGWRIAAASGPKDYEILILILILT